jgi:hypothetical protein
MLSGFREEFSEGSHSVAAHRNTLEQTVVDLDLESVALGIIAVTVDRYHYRPGWQTHVPTECEIVSA